MENVGSLGPYLNRGVFLRTSSLTAQSFDILVLALQRYRLRCADKGEAFNIHHMQVPWSDS